jgi:hypothetical protein
MRKMGWEWNPSDTTVRGKSVHHAYHCSTASSRLRMRAGGTGGLEMRKKSVGTSTTVGNGIELVDQGLAACGLPAMPQATPSSLSWTRVAR